MTQPDTLDPLEMWRTMRDATLEAWSKSLNEFVNTDSYAKTMGALMDTYLTAAIPMRQATEKSATYLLEQVNMPTRADVIGIAERLTHIEMRLDDMDAKLDQILQVRNKEQG